MGEGEGGRGGEEEGRLPGVLGVGEPLGLVVGCGGGLVVICGGGLVAVDRGEGGWIVIICEFVSL